MQKVLIGGLTSAALVLGPIAAARAETSIACMYMLMRVYHAELDTCHVPLSKDREERYQHMRTDMEKFIHANAKNDPNKILLASRRIISRVPWRALRIAAPMISNMRFRRSTRSRRQIAKKWLREVWDCRGIR